MCSSLRTKKVGLLIFWWHNYSESLLSQPEMEHDLLHNVTHAAQQFLLSQQRCSIQFLNEEPKLSPPLSLPSPSFSSAHSSVPITRLHRDPHCQADSSHKDVIKDFCLTNINSNIWAKVQARRRRSSELTGCRRCLTEYHFPRVLISRLGSKDRRRDAVSRTIYTAQIHVWQLRWC